MQHIRIASTIIAVLTLLGCSSGREFTTPSLDGRHPEASDLLITPQVSGDQMSLAAVWDLTIDPDTLSTTLTPARTPMAQPPQALRYDLDIGKFLSPNTLQIAGVGTGPFRDVIVDFRQKHPFPAPDFSTAITARNRADLGYTGRLLILADTVQQSLPVGSVSVDPWLVREPDGYMDPGDLLRSGEGLSNTHFPYVLLVDEAKDNREGVSNGGNPQGNYDVAGGGWQQDNAGVDGDGWSGYDYLHGGQSCLNSFTLRRTTLEQEGWSVRLAVVIQYTDPRGMGGPDRRFPLDPPDALEFAYRLPYAALDVSRLSGCWDYYLHQDADAFTTLEFRLRDWDARATEAADADISDETDVSLIQPGGRGTPQLQLVVPDLLAAPLLLSSTEGTGEAGDEFVFTGDISNPLGAAGGFHWGVLQAVDPEFGDPDRTDYHFGVDAESLAPDTTRALAPITLLPIRINVAADTLGWARHWGESPSEAASAVTVDADENVYVAGSYFSFAGDVDPEDCQLELPAPPFGYGYNYLLKFNSWGKLLWVHPYGVPGGSTTLEDIQVDANGDLLVDFKTRSAPLDVDPGPGEAFIGGVGINGEALVKYDPAGDLIWVAELPLTTPTFNEYYTQMLAFDTGTDGSIYWAGKFGQTRDFDPGPGTEELTASTGENGRDACLLKLNSDGTYGWVYAWSAGGPIALNSMDDVKVGPDSKVVVAGLLALGFNVVDGEVDLDPTAGEDMHPCSVQGSGVFVVLDPAGTYVHGNAWGESSPIPEEPNARIIIEELAVDSQNRPVMFGKYNGDADFDPGPGVAPFDAGEALLRSFIIAFDETGAYRWAEDYEAEGFSFGPDLFNLWTGPADNIYLLGLISSTLDFDPGAGTDEQTPGVNGASFLSSFESDGTYRYAKLLNNPGGLVYFDLGPTPGGLLAGCGIVRADDDLDFGPAERTYPIVGFSDAFFAFMDPEGEWE